MDSLKSILTCFFLLSLLSAIQGQRLERSNPADPTVQNSQADHSPFEAGAIARTAAILDDASLNDVCGVGDFCIAVGARGVICRSKNSGTTWTASAVSVDAHLSSVCFLTNRIGWTAGWRFDARAQTLTGVLLATRDAGETWTDLTRTEHSVRTTGRLIDEETGLPLTEGCDLPAIRFVRFFDTERGIVACGADQGQIGGLYRTTDGGQTWKQLASDTENADWQTADFSSPHGGIVVGAGSSFGTVVGSRLLTLNQPRQSLRGFRDAHLSQSGRGWIVGDAGLLLHSVDNGVSWKAPPRPLASQLNHVLDFRTVDQRGAVVCLAGSPGNIVVHSEDSGRSWKFRRVSVPTPIHKIRFLTEKICLAVGALGVIHRSDDAGRSWRTVRNGKYRAGVLSVAGNPQTIPFRMLTQVSGEEGYRAVVVQQSARLTTQHDDRSRRDRLQLAIPLAGGSQFCQDWMFSRAEPLQAAVRGLLLDEWAGQTDGRVSEELIQRLARWIRIWRPDTVVIQSSGGQDELSRLWSESISKAVIMARTHTGGLLDRVGLPPWPTTQVVVQSHSSQSSITYRGDDLLPIRATSIDLVAQHAQACGVPESVIDEDGERYQTHPAPQFTPVTGHILGGRRAAHGTPSRRVFEPPLHDVALLADLASRNRTQKAALRGQLRISKSPLGLMAQLRTIGTGQPQGVVIQQLAFLADLYRQAENLDGEISVLQELVQRFPEAPQSVAAAEKLFFYFSSRELRRLRIQQSDSAAAGGIRPAAARIPGIPPGSTQAPANGPVVNAADIGVQPEVVSAGGGNFLPVTSRDRQEVGRIWDRNAATALSFLQRTAAARASAPDILLRRAANARLAQKFNDARQLLSSAATGDSLFATLAQAEMSAAFGAGSERVPILNVKSTTQRPVLDARLDEAIWADAEEWHLATANSRAPLADCLIMMVWDSEFIYIGGRVSYSGTDHVSPDRTQAREHDADHGTRDRVVLKFDPDRDFSTAAEFVIDDRGQTSERLWEARRWNPKWFVADAADRQSWRFEAAIPMSALQPHEMQSGTLWAIQLQRLVPGQGIQFLAAEESRPEKMQGHGFVRFIR